MTDELKEKIKELKELEEKKRKIEDEIYHLRDINKGYWIGIGYDRYGCSTEYHRLGWCSEPEAREIMSKNNDFVFFHVREVTMEYNKKMYKAERLQNVIRELDDEDFSKYEEAKDAMEDELLELKEELEISEYCRIY